MSSALPSYVLSSFPSSLVIPKAGPTIEYKPMISTVSGLTPVRSRYEGNWVGSCNNSFDKKTTDSSYQKGGYAAPAYSKDTDSYFRGSREYKPYISSSADITIQRETTSYVNGPYGSHTPSYGSISTSSPSSYYTQPLPNWGGQQQSQPCPPCPKPRTPLVPLVDSSYTPTSYKSAYWRRPLNIYQDLFDQLEKNKEEERIRQEAANRQYEEKRKRQRIYDPAQQKVDYVDLLHTKIKERRRASSVPVSRKTSNLFSPQSDCLSRKLF